MQYEDKDIANAQEAIDHSWERIKHEINFLKSVIKEKNAKIKELEDKLFTSYYGDHKLHLKNSLEAMIDGIEVLVLDEKDS